MGDKGKILFGLAVFVILVTYPFWSRLAAAGEPEGGRPELELPANETDCIEETSFMTANHMDLLNQWRDGLVRDGNPEYTAADGKTYLKSLTKPAWVAMRTGMPFAPAAMTTPMYSPHAGNATRHRVGGPESWKRRAAGRS